MHGYPPFQGRAELREAIAAHYRADHGVELDPDREVAVVPGTKTAIMLAVLACAGAGQAVALPDPGYPDYLSAVALARRAHASRCRSTPPPAGSPTSTRWAPSARRSWSSTTPPTRARRARRRGPSRPPSAWAHERGAWLLNDLAYAFLAFDGRRARSVLEVDGAREVAVELWSPSKVYGMAGWRVGFAVGNAEVVGRIRLLLDHLAAGVPVALQLGLVAALSGDQGHVRERFEVYRRRRDVLVQGLGLQPPEGTFYAWWRLPDGLTAERLLTEQRVAVAPGRGLRRARRGYARLSLAVDDADLDEGVARLAARSPRSLEGVHLKRVIPCLDVDAGRVVKGTNFVDIRDAGDPVELAERYDAEGADELVFLDITATHEKRDTMVELARRTADNVFVPFTIGGGIRSVADAQAVLDAGADKVSVNSAAVARPELIDELADRFGAQCVVLAIDAKRERRRRGRSSWPAGARRPGATRWRGRARAPSAGRGRSCSRAWTATAPTTATTSR